MVVLDPDFRRADKLNDYTEDGGVISSRNKADEAGN